MAAFLQLLELGRTVLVSDVDTVWVGDPLAFLDTLEAKAVDVAVTSDCLSREADENKDGKSSRFHPNGVWFCGHNPGNTFGATFNTGVLVLRPTAAAKDFTRRWRDLLLAPTDDLPTISLRSPILSPCDLPTTSLCACRWRDLLLAPTDDWHMEDQRGFNQLVMTNFYPTVAAASVRTFHEPLP